MRCESVPDPKIEEPRDAIVKVTACAICGSDLHFYDGIIPTMERGDVVGHEAIGEVLEVGKDVSGQKKGDRVVVPFTISCGECFFCKRGFYSGCECSNPNAAAASRLWGHSPAGLFSYSHLLGGFLAGQAEYLRVPFADVGPMKVPEGLTDEQVLFLSDIFPTGYMAAENCEIQGGETIAVFGCGPVAQFAIRSAFLLGAERVIAIRHRARAPGHGGGRRGHPHRFYEGRRVRADPGADAGPRRGCLHRRGSALSRTRPRASTRCWIAQKLPPSSAPSARMCCGRQSITRATSAWSRSSAYMAGSSTRFRWAARSIEA